MTVVEAYAECRKIAKREAKNFYYSFRVLPRPKSDAMCAVYAFMRRADDLADDESITVAERRVLMAEWVGDWRANRAGGKADDAVFVALRDAQKRFGIGDALLEDLVRGTTLDLLEQQAGVAEVAVSRRAEGGGTTETYSVYETFEDLYRYCYLVASVVGLTCIQVFGYKDVAAVGFAEHTGIAFQLTNILRDVKEDAERGRIYLPLDDMQATGVSVEHVALAAREDGMGEAVKPLLVREYGRAKEYYRSAERLLPLIDRDSRAALWVMVTIYRTLLERIEAGGYRVGKRARVATWQKMAILGRGLAMAAWYRVTA